jgi:hypothetical protein
VLTRWLIRTAERVSLLPRGDHAPLKVYPPAGAHR